MQTLESTRTAQSFQLLFMLLVRKSQCHSFKTKLIKNLSIELILWNYINKHNLHRAGLLCGLWWVCRGFVSKPKSGDSKTFPKHRLLCSKHRISFCGHVWRGFWIINVCNKVSLGWLKGPLPLFLMAVFGGVSVTYIFLEFEHLETGFNDLEADPEMYCSLTTSDHECWQYTSVLPWLAIRTQFYLTEASERGSWRGVSFRLLDGPLHVQWRAILSFFNFSQSIAEVPKKAGKSWSHSALPWDDRARGMQTLLLRRCAPGAYV